MKKRVLSGIRATGRLHLGNYLGAVKGMLELAQNKELETYYMVADVHTLTTPYNPEELRINRRQVIIDYLAAGLDPDNSVLFIQSQVSEHLELAFYLSSLVSIARMRHLPTFKDKVKQHPKHATMALLNYPILMASDILAYQAHFVPVGIDQEPHLEITREIARKVNDQFNLDWPEPVRFVTAGEYVPSLKGEGKMSKSVEGSYINLNDDLDTISKKIALVPTDSGQGDTLPETGGVATLFKLIKLVEGEAAEKEAKMAYLNQGLRYKQLKTELSQAIFAMLEPMQQKHVELEQDIKYIDKVIAQGAKQAREVVAQTLDSLRYKLGLW